MKTKHKPPAALFQFSQNNISCWHSRIF